MQWLEEDEQDVDKSGGELAGWEPRCVLSKAGAPLTRPGWMLLLLLLALTHTGAGAGAVCLYPLRALNTEPPIPTPPHKCHCPRETRLTCVRECHTQALYIQALLALRLQLSAAPVSAIFPEVNTGKPEACRGHGNWRVALKYESESESKSGLFSSYFF